MNENRISIDLLPADITAINQAINTLAQKLQPVLLALNEEDKKNIPKLGERSLAYAEKTVQYSQSNPEFLPAYVDAAELKKDFDGYLLLNGFLRQLAQIVKNLDDTATLSGSEAISAVSAYYKSVKYAAAMGVPNAKAIYDDLSQRFEAQKTRKSKPEELK